MNNPNRSLNVVFIAFVVSGFAALMYQSVWSRYLGLLLGHAAYAQTMVLCLFMGGMALGAWLAAALTDRQPRRLVWWYVLAEVWIGVAAVAFHWAFVGATAFMTTELVPAMPSASATTALKLGVAIALIGLQCVALGMTFPLLASAVVRANGQAAGGMLAQLYFSNSIGAAFGALAATFLIVPALGLPGAMQVGGALNLIVAILVYFALGNRRELDPAPAKVDHSRAQADSTSNAVLIVMALTLGSAAASFIYEVAWIRMLSLVLGSTIHAFELMLSAFILGLALGSRYVRKRIDGYDDPLRVAGVAQVLMGLSALATVFVYPFAFDGTAALMQSLARSPGGYTIFLVFSATVAILVMAPTAFFAGMTLPLFSTALIRRGESLKVIGRVYAANTFGAIVGAVIGVHFLIPALGLKLTVIAGAAIALLIGIVILRFLVQQYRLTAYGAALVGSALSVALALAIPKFEAATLASGVYRSSRSAIPDTDQVVFYRDGKTASIAVARSSNSGTTRIATNGKIDASIARPDAPPTGDESTMVLAATLPMRYRSSVESAAVIGFGSGLSTHTLLGLNGIKVVDTVEIEPMMVLGAREFGSSVARAYTDARSNVIIDDAKTYLSGQRRVYDAIVSEPSNPWVSGVASLFTTEFYQFTRKHLKDDGVLVQWIQLYEINTDLVLSILGALNQHFPHFHLYMSNSSDMLVVASPTELVALNSPRGSNELIAELTRLGIATAAENDIRLIATSELIAPFLALADLPVNSDYYPIVANRAPQARFVNAFAAEFAQLPNARAPYLAVLSGIDSPDQSSSIGHQPENPRVTMTLVARQIETALNDPEKSHFIGDPLFALTAAAFPTMAEACFANVAPQVALETLYQLSSIVNRSGTKGGRQTLWVDQQWMTCDARTLPPVIREFLAMTAAVAKRDPTAMRSSADVLLKQHDQWLSDTIREYVINIALLGAARSLPSDEAAQVAKVLRDLPVGTDPGETALRTFLNAKLLAHTPTPTPTSSADTLAP